MRAHFQTQQGVSFPWFKRRYNENPIQRRKEAFYRYATMLPIPAITEKEWLPYISQKFASRNIRADEDVIKEIIHLSSGHPQDTMFVCSEIYYALLETGYNILTLDYVRLGYERAMLTLVPVLDEILDDLGRPQVRKVLYQLAGGENAYQEGTHPNKVKRAIDLLMSKAVIKKTARGSYVFVEPMFQQYILREGKSI